MRPPPRASPPRQPPSADGAQSVHIGELEFCQQHLNPKHSSAIKLWGCGNLVHEEKPREALKPIELFLQGLGIFMLQSDLAAAE